MILVDTNIPLRIAQIGHPHRQIALDALQLLTKREAERFAIAPQSLYEMYVVCSRPISNNGFGMSPQQARAEIISARGIFEILPDSAEVYPIWEGLIAKHAVQGKQAHDVRLVAIMIQHRVRRILTFNDIDFRRFTEVGTLSPFDVLAIPRT